MKISISFITLLLANTLIAQDSTQPKILDEVIVSGQITPQSLKKSVYQVRTITKERIQQQGATNLQTVLSAEPNIRFTQDVATGGANISLLGMSGQNVKILVDGLPLIGRQGINNEINVNQIDINTIERVEIIEGPMSVLYGADALGGIINIITKKIAHTKLSIAVKLHEETIGNAYGTTQGIHNPSINVTSRFKNVSIGGGLAYNYFGGWKDTAIGRELVWHKKNQLLANAFIAYNTKNVQLKYRIDGIDEIINNPGNFQAFPDPFTGQTVAYDQENLTKRVMHQLQGQYQHTKKWNIQLQSSYTDFTRQVYSTMLNATTNKRSIDPGSGKQSMINFTGYTIRSIFNYIYSPKLTLQAGTDVNGEEGTGERLQKGNNTIIDYALFANAEYQPIHFIKIRPGIRFIKNSVYNAPPAIFSLNTKIQVSKKIDVKAAYSNGFRAPSLRELYFNFFDANHQIIGNQNLKAETSNSITTSITHQTTLPKQWQLTNSLTGFYNSVKNLIDYAVVPSNPNIFQLTNVSNSTNAGINFISNLRNQYLSVGTGLGYTGFYNILYETNKSLPQLQWSPEITCNTSYTFAKQAITFGVYYKYVGRRPFYTFNSNQAMVQAYQQDYHLADITLSKIVAKKMTLQLGCRNIGNTTRLQNSLQSGGIHSASGVQNIATGRGYFVSINYQWNKK